MAQASGRQTPDLLRRTLPHASSWDSEVRPGTQTNERALNACPSKAQRRPAHDLGFTSSYARLESLEISISPASSTPVRPSTPRLIPLVSRHSTPEAPISQSFHPRYPPSEVGLGFIDRYSVQYRLSIPSSLFSTLQHHCSSLTDPAPHLCIR
ncbi:hypothetical protein BDV06DRAFT_157844 [Aspergillus oleicola]